MKLQQMSQSLGHCPNALKTLGNALKTLGNALKTLGIGKALRRLPGIRTFPEIIQSHNNYL